MHAHLAFVTQYRRDVFIKEILNNMRSIFARGYRNFSSERVEFDGEGDHDHVLMHYAPKVSV